MNTKLYKTLDEVYKEEVLIRLNLFDGNKSKVAKSLGISQKTLYNKIHEWGLNRLIGKQPKIRKPTNFMNQILPKGLNNG